MRALTIVLISVLLLECLYLAECQGKDRDRDSDRRRPPCSRVCNSPMDCGPPCRRCVGGFWRSYQCRE
uniref:Putative secreted peptide of 4.99 kDa n=1 Tax=Ixodes ricinus TaxID=34613 RepID=V5I4K7_IXORI